MRSEVGFKSPKTPKLALTSAQVSAAALAPETALALASVPALEPVMALELACHMALDSDRLGRKGVTNRGYGF